ncbi:DUF5610 domain-containing protein [Hahella ganghwensis]|uniref:DUF5610 domain-containing protein n=1 Tax=Hahella ganghwensis TaxID=286420 RepID=UPI00037E39F4|nr:DUF5610 domain-containing protein [Hahella ganghwensis]
MFQGIGSLNQFVAGFSHGGGHPPQHSNGLGNGNALSISHFSFSAEYSSTQISLSSEGFFAERRQFSAQVFEARMSGRLSDFRSSEAPSYQAEVPSPQDVANRILGFVEQRIAREAESGASQEELESLFAQAVEGIDTGYGEALEELEARGLVTEELQADIDEGYGLIQVGLADLREKYLVDESNGNAEGDEASIPDGVDLVDEDSVVAQSSQAGQAAEDDASSDDAGQSSVDGSGLSRLAQAFAYNRTELAANDLGLTVTTRDGDKVTVYVGAASGSETSAIYAGRGQNEYLGMSRSSFESSGFELLVEGDLDDEELAALGEMLAQIEEIAGSFFAGDLDSAFSAALELDVDMSEIASYAVSMSSTRYEQVGVAYQSSRSPAAERFQPLADQVPKFAGALAQAGQFSDSVSLIEQVMDRLVSRVEVERANNEQFMDFARQLLGQLSA